MKKFVNALIYFFKFNIYYAVVGQFYTVKERIGRSYAFAKHGWLHYDFEGLYVYDIIAFKLRRVYSALRADVAWQSDEDLAALLEAIDICDRLFKSAYEDFYLEPHYKTWNLYQLDFDILEKNPREKFTPEQTELEREQFMIACNQAESDRCADIDRLAQILKNNSLTWWS